MLVCQKLFFLTLLAWITNAKQITKRSVSSPRFIELLVVADGTMSDFYVNEDLVSYLLTIVNSVSKLFQHGTVGNSLSIQVVRLMTLDVTFSEEDENGNCSGELMLDRFCTWQNSINTGNDTDPDHHDAALLITRCKLCTNSSGQCATYGLAEFGGICHPLRSCSIARDTGLYTTYTIAHELGHNLGMPHDNGRTPCAKTSAKTAEHFLMARSLSSLFNISNVWSNCSRDSVTNFLDRNELECLNDKSDHAYLLEDVLPGIKYSADDQCRLFFGSDSTSCAVTDKELSASCEMLWCRRNGNCVSKGEKAADGTECGKYMWCIQGKCVQAEESPLPVDGRWGDWSSWSECSRTCGGGVSYSERSCDNPNAENGGRFCIGERRRYRLCNTDGCVNATTSFRGEQCQAFNNIPYENKYYLWTPVYIQGSPCQLHCKPENTSFVVSLAELVIDGTPCHPGKRNVCINGVCKKVGCDWVINSDASEDICGICSGTGKTCKRIQNFEQEGLNCSASPFLLATIPPTAKNIRIVHTTDSNEGLIVQGPNYLKLQAALSVGWSGEFLFGENILHYSRNVGTGTVYIPGPVDSEHTLWFICYIQGGSRVDWEYVLPLQNETEVFDEYRWESGEWSSCSASCGEGLQISLSLCVRTENQTVVSDSFCANHDQPPAMQRSCLLQNCPPSWWTGAWQPCSDTCGFHSYRRRTILCVVNIDGIDIPLEDVTACNSPKPIEEEICQLRDCELFE